MSSTIGMVFPFYLSRKQRRIRSEMATNPKNGPEKIQGALCFLHLRSIDELFHQHCVYVLLVWRRVCGELAVSRSIGDRDFKGFTKRRLEEKTEGVAPLEVRTYRHNPNDESSLGPPCTFPFFGRSILHVPHCRNGGYKNGVALQSIIGSDLS